MEDLAEDDSIAELLERVGSAVELEEVVDLGRAVSKGRKSSVGPAALGKQDAYGFQQRGLRACVVDWHVVGRGG